MKTPLSPRRFVAGLCGFIALALANQQITAQNTGPQQLVFAGLLGSTNPNAQFNAQFNAVQSDASGNLYLLLDQKDGVRLLKTDPTATSILAQTQFGTAGDTGVASGPARKETNELRRKFRRLAGVAVLGFQH